MNELNSLSGNDLSFIQKEKCQKYLIIMRGIFSMIGIILGVIFIYHISCKLINRDVSDTKCYL